MREIKFRGKTYYRNWCFGDYWHYCHHHIKTEDGVDWEIDKRTISQFTGLRDKNGVEIYEGDIVKTKYHELRDFGDEIEDYYSEFVEEVTWLTSLNGFGLKIMIEDIPLYRPLDFVREVNGIKLIELEVIGNIYDNPELLEVEE